MDGIGEKGGDDEGGAKVVGALDDAWLVGVQQPLEEGLLLGGDAAEGQVDEGKRLLGDLVGDLLAQLLGVGPGEREDAGRLAGEDRSEVAGQHGGELVGVVGRKGQHLGGEGVLGGEGGEEREQRVGEAEGGQRRALQRVGRRVADEARVVGFRGGRGGGRRKGRRRWGG